jgi:hypothetical protein
MADSDISKADPKLGADGTPEDRGQARQKPEKQMGEDDLKDKDAPTSDTYGETRESGEQPK